MECCATRPPVLHFLLSTKPAVSPPQIVKSVKGRLQHRIRATCPDAFRRNFSLSSVGDVRQDVVENYVSNQLGHHHMADPQIQERLRGYQLEFPDADLSVPVFSSHGRYLYNLHVVFANDGRWHEVREDRLAKTRDMVLGVAQARPSPLTCRDPVGPCSFGSRLQD